MKFLIFGFVIFSLISCVDSGPITTKTNQAQQLRERAESRPAPRRSCDSDKGEYASISRAENISSNNAGEYRLSGRCNSESREITVSIANNSLDVACSGGRFGVNLDLTSIIQGEDRVDISVEDGSDIACVTVSNNFNCPDEYVAIPRLDGFTKRDFCVMKYEASREFSSSSRGFSRSNDDNSNADEKAISKSGDGPWTEISQIQAQNKCRNNGLGYRLIRNDEWQTIARHVEDEGQNWSSGKSSSVANNFLNYGINYSRSSNSYRSSRNSREDYANKDWEPNKRSHILPNGEEIWDMSGGVWEYIEETASSLGARDEDDEPIFDVDKNKDIFGPSNHYSEPSYDSDVRNSTLGLGYAHLSSVEVVVVRGGGTSEYDLGIFSVDASLENDGFAPYPTGFRCVYEP